MSLPLINEIAELAPGVRLNYADAGDALKTMVLIHG